MGFIETIKKILSKKRKIPKVGLALGSGGSKGLAHIGVIKILEENNIPIDLIAGSSLGAIVGAGYALTKDIEAIQKVALDMKYSDILSPFDLSLHKGLVTGEKMEDFLRKNLGDAYFDDLKIPFKVVTTNCQNAQPFIIDKGPLVPALHASTCVPMAFHPMKWQDGKYLWDGGMSISVPADLVRSMGADIVIAVNVDADYFSSSPPDLNMNIIKIAYHGIDMFRYHLAKYNVQNADIVIEPKLGEMAWYDLSVCKRAINAGEEATRSQIKKIQKLISQYG